MSFFELFIWSCWGLVVFCGLVAGAVEDGTGAAWCWTASEISTLETIN